MFAHQYGERIHRAWLGFLETEPGNWHELPDVGEYPRFYAYLKHQCGEVLTLEEERAALIRVRNGERAGFISPANVTSAREAGLLSNDFAPNEVIAWARICCAMVFSRWGVNSVRVFQVLNIDKQMA